MDFFKVQSIDAVQKRLLDFSNKCQLKTEKVALLQAINRVNSHDIISTINVPEFNRSTVDGYAIRSKDSHGASETIPSLVNLKGEVLMGLEASIEIDQFECVYVPTGGMIPKGANSMIMIEDCEKFDDETIALNKSVALGENMIFKGDDVKVSDLVLKKNTLISALDIGVLAALGLSEIQVYQKPRVTIISTGDEIIDMDEPLSQGKIRDINGYVLDSLATSFGCDIVKRLIIKDEYEDLLQAVEEASNESELVLISGGSSVGTRDYTHSVINNLEGQGVFVHGLAIKPGKPTIIGEVNNTLIFGLPGHPVSSIIVYKILVEYYLGHILKLAKGHTISQKAILSENVHGAPGRRTYQMVQILQDGDEVLAKPYYGKSGMITLLAKADGYIIIEESMEGSPSGENVIVYSF